VGPAIICLLEWHALLTLNLVLLFATVEDHPHLVGLIIVDDGKLCMDEATTMSALRPGIRIQTGPKLGCLSEHSVLLSIVSTLTRGGRCHTRCI
jgi:hypothetical protein